MIVCLCEGLSDRQLRRAIEEGCDSVAALAQRTRAATGCGMCACDLKQLLLEGNDSGEASPVPPPGDTPLAAK